MMQKEQKVMAVMAVAVMVMASTMAVIKITAPPTNMNLPDASQYDNSYDSYIKTVGINRIDYNRTAKVYKPTVDIDMDDWLNYFSYVPKLTTKPVNWNNGKLYPLWQSGTFKIKYIRAHPSSAGHVGGKVDSITCYTNMYDNSLFQSWANKESAVVLIKFVGIMPYAVWGRAFLSGSGMSIRDNPKKISLDCGFKFGANGIYMIGIFMDLVHVKNSVFTEETVQFFSLPFGIS